MISNQKCGLRWMMLSTFIIGLAVMLGAFGAHGLKSTVHADFIAIWQTGVLYQFFHGIGLFLLGLLFMIIHQKSELITRQLQIIGCLFTMGTLLFSGSLYVLVISGIKILGIVTPIGGGAFIMGWILFFIALFRYYRNI